MDCLVTKLKANIVDDSLLRIGEGEFEVSLTTAASAKIVGSDGNSGYITIVGDGFLTQGGVQQKSIPFSAKSFSMPAGNYKLRVSDKYSIVAVENVPYFDLENIRYSDGLYTLASRNGIGDIGVLQGKAVQYVVLSNGTNIIGNLSEISDSLGKVVEFTARGCNFKGDVACFGTTKTSPIQIQQCKGVTGSLEGLVSALVSNGTTSGSKTLCLYKTNVTIGGSVRDLRDTLSKIVWLDASTFYYQTDTDAAVANAEINVTIYAKNATSSQISAWKGNNNTVVEI